MTPAQTLAALILPLIVVGDDISAALDEIETHDIGGCAALAGALGTALDDEDLDEGYLAEVAPLVAVGLLVLRSGGVRLPDPAAARRLLAGT